MAKDNIRSAYPFATKTGIELLFYLLIRDGAMCYKCGYGTKITSKNWAKCKKCGERIKREIKLTSPKEP